MVVRHSTAEVLGSLAAVGGRAAAVGGGPRGGEAVTNGGGCGSGAGVAVAEESEEGGNGGGGWEGGGRWVVVGTVPGLVVVAVGTKLTVNVAVVPCWCTTGLWPEGVASHTPVPMSMAMGCWLLVEMVWTGRSGGTSGPDGGIGGGGAGGGRTGSGADG